MISPWGYNFQMGGLTYDRDVEKYVKGCDMCQRMKNRMEVMIGKLSKIPEKL